MIVYPDPSLQRENISSFPRFPPKKKPPRASLPRFSAPLPRPAAAADHANRTCASSSARCACGCVCVRVCVPRSDDRVRTNPQVYALVAREKTVLAEYTATSGNFPTVTRVLLAKIPPADGRMSYVYDK